MRVICNDTGGDRLVRVIDRVGLYLLPFALLT